MRVSRDVRGSAERIAEVPGVHYVLTGVGRFDVIGGADATSRAGLLEVLEATRAVATVRELEAWYHLEIVKESYAVDLPGMALPSSS